MREQYRLEGHFLCKVSIHFNGFYLWKVKSHRQEKYCTLLSTEHTNLAAILL